LVVALTAFFVGEGIRIPLSEKGLNFSTVVVSS
jgi:hypothetical protein